MNKNRLASSILKSMRLCTLAFFLQFAVVNDGYSYFINGVQPIRPASSLANVFAVTVDLHQRIILRESFSFITEAHRVITVGTILILKTMQTAFRSCRAPRIEPVSLHASATHNPSERSLSAVSRLAAQKENYIGGKKESWTKFEAPRVDRFSASQPREWDGVLIDELIENIQRALLDAPGPDPGEKMRMRRIHYSSEGDPAIASSIGITEAQKSPRPPSAGWLFYWASFEGGNR